MQLSQVPALKGHIHSRLLKNKQAPPNKNKVEQTCEWTKEKKELGNGMK